MLAGDHVPKLDMPCRYTYRSEGCDRPQHGFYSIVLESSRRVTEQDHVRRYKQMIILIA